MKTGIVAAMAMLVSLAGCAQPKRQIQLDTSRLLTEDPMQGWTVLDKAPPVVGEFDVIYMGESSTGSGSATECSYVTGPEGTITACPDNQPARKARPSRIRSDSRSI